MTREEVLGMDYIEEIAEVTEDQWKLLIRSRTGWISVEDKKPEREQRVLVLVRHKAFLRDGMILSRAIAHIPANNDYWKIGNDIRGWDATTLFETVMYWRPLPRKVAS